MKKAIQVTAMCLLAAAMNLYAQPNRTDAIWARTAPAGSITIDGVMNEPAWSSAESLYVEYGKSVGLPGSGYTVETGVILDSIKAVVKFLVMGDSLYVAYTVKDSSIGGGIFGAADAIIFNIRDKSDNLKHPSPSGEYLWGWINESWMDPGNVTAVGAMPKIGPTGKYQKTEFETATTVKGVTNTDGMQDNVLVDPTKLDTSYTVEMKISLKPRGYHVSDPNGDIVMYNAAIRDCDWAWPFQDFVTFSRVWIQGPWANNSEKDFMRIYVRPDVTISSGAAPKILPDYTIPDGKMVDTPVIDGKLDEPVWGKIAGLDIRYGNDSLRNSYSGVGPFASGEFQADVNGGTATITDTAAANVKMFFKGDTLYVGVDVQDRFVQYHSSFDRWDGMMITINGLGKDHQNEVDHDQIARKLTIRVGSDGSAMLMDYLPILDSLKGSHVKISLGSETTIDTIGLNEDNGYQIESAFDLTKLGYPHGLGDGVLYIGLSLLDGDSFIPATLSYGTRTWWYRENDGGTAPAFVYMDPSDVITGVSHNEIVHAPSAFTLYGNFPNPFNPSTSIKYALPHDGNVTLAVYDMLGRTVASVAIGAQSAGEQSYSFNASGLSSGVFFYRLYLNAGSGKEFSTPIAKMVFLK